MQKTRFSKEISIGNVKIGANNPISIQSMTNTDTRDSKKTIEQIKLLEDAGCEIVRVAVPDELAADSLKEIKKNISIPLVADIHFDYRLAIKSIENGVDKIRINPGNIGDNEKIFQIVSKAKEFGIPIRIGVNSGSLEKDILDKYGKVTAEGLVESCLRHIKILEELDYNNIIISIKSSSVSLSLESYKSIAEKVPYPLHIGITEAGTIYSGSIKSAVGLGAILSRGIGDTIRVSLTDSPLEEIKCAKEILKALELRKFGIEFISCPTCGRTEINLIELAKKAEEYCSKLNKNIKVAVMGCVVNGPGEAKEADLGIAGGKNCGVLFKKGQVIKTLKEEELLPALFEEIEKFTND